jgi:uncharacterized protein YyaL (SSP411 family)
MNRLATEASPYLRDHAENPVDWYPWGEEALGRARQENKPIFLSIGYSACHWCHVMARESFADEKIAAILNENFISIKVDREERPDLDEVYVEAVRIMTGSAGWPLSVFLTPETRPFYGGTYFPPEPRQGLAAFDRVLAAVLHYFRTERHEIDEAGNRITVELNRLSSLSAYAGEMDDSPLRGFCAKRLEVFDSEHGGFGVAPKFPNPCDLSLLLSLSGRPGCDMARQMAELTLHKMAEGGICDQLGGGFHRYSTDTVWLVPHFEKMLYDNALLARTYLRAFVATGEELYRCVAADTLGFMERELALPGGGFAAALDADSGAREGAYYLWTPAQVEAAVGPELARLACDFFGVSGQGCFEGASVLHTAVPIEQLLTAHHVTVPELWPKLAEIRARMLGARNQRSGPRHDDKVLADWNGLALSALALGARVLGGQARLEQAQTTADFLRREMVKDGEVVHFRRPGLGDMPGLLPDYALVAQGLIDLFEADFDVHHLETALSLTDRMLELFGDPDGGFFTTRAGEPGILSRIKNGYDGAIPSGNSVAVVNLLRLARLCGRDDYERTAAAALRRFYRTMVEYPPAFSVMLSGLDLLLQPGTEVVLFLSAASPEGDRMESLLVSVPDEHRTTVIVKAPKPDEVMRRLIPLTDGRSSIGNKPTAYVCRGSTCVPPAHTREELAKVLGHEEQA